MSSFVSYPIRFATQWNNHASDPSCGISAQIAASGVTDPGGARGSVNQDAFFSFCDPHHGAMVIGVFDGHGKETGREVALAARNYFEAHFQSFTAQQYEALEQNPQQCFHDMFLACHLAIKGILKAVYERRGFVVKEQDEYMVKASTGAEHSSSQVTCVRGGTTATLVVIIDGGRKIFTANVGDSSAMIGAKTSILRQSDILVHEDVTDPAASKDDGRASSSEKTRRPNGPSSTLMLTGEHSPDSEREFLRARAFRRCAFNRQMPELRFLFDSCNARAKRTPIFQVASNGDIRQKRKGEYLKNIRDEWATVVATPAECAFPDALAFTRSLGDFHMHTFGVSCEPSVREISLERVLRRRFGWSGENQHEHHHDDVAASTDSENNNDSDEDAPVELMLVVASDGVWDTWQFDELFQFVHRGGTSNGKRSAALQKQASDETGCPHTQAPYPIDKTVSALMAANLKRARSIFGDDADNMTVVLCHFQLECSRLRELCH